MKDGHGFMSMKWKAAIIMPLLLCGALWGDGGWQRVRSADGIAIYLRDTAESGIRECRGVMTLEGVTLSSLMALMNDVPAYTGWMSGAFESKELARAGLSERVIYMAQKFPFGLQDRDFVTRSTVRQDQVSKIITISFSAVPNYIPEVPGRLRVRLMRGHWAFRPKGGGTVEVEYDFLMDPGGDVFDWMINNGLPDPPMRTLRAMRNAVKAVRYKNARFPDVREP